ncbi:MAG: hypothetical protein DRJ47_05105 [Thermoprotei archaeon]|nr:MAG: hypothetical protein DRJ47_05105 [Thermoprotei archaeon]
MYRKASLMFLPLIIFTLVVQQNIYTAGGSADIDMRSIGILICSDVYGVGNYTLKVNPIFSPGEKVYIYTEITLSSPSGSNFTYLLNWHIIIYDPLGALISEDSNSIGPKVAQGYITYALWYFLDFDREDLEGPYLIILEATEAYSGKRIVEKGFFYLYNATPLKVLLNLNVTLVFENRGYSLGFIDQLKLALAISVPPFQILLTEPELSPEPTRVIVDQYGNQYAAYSTLIIPTGGRTEVKARYRILLNWTYRPDPGLTFSSLTLIHPYMKSYITPCRFIESNSSDVVDLAEKMKDAVTSPYEVSKEISKFLGMTIKYDENIGDDKGALWTLRNKRGKCTQFARLFVALERALGIPSQLVFGLRLDPIMNTLIEVGEEKAHAWAEFYLPGIGWIQAEPQGGGVVFGRNPPGPFYITFVRTPCEENTTASLYFFVARGTIKTVLKISYLATPYTPKHKHSLKLTSDKKIYYVGDSALIQGSLSPESSKGLYMIYVFPPWGGVKTMIVDPAKEGLKITVELQETGTWGIKAVWSGTLNDLPSESNKLVLKVSKHVSYIFFDMKTQLDLGDPIIVKGALNPPLKGVPLKIVLKDPLGNIHTFTITTSSDGGFEVPLGYASIPGEWTVEVSWEGNDKYLPSTNSITIKVGFARAFMALAIVTVVVVLVLIFRRKGGS